jgi:CRP-like cAMP-binding protein
MKFRNAFLSAIGPEDLAAFGRVLSEVTLNTGQMLCQAGAPMRDVYFPSGAVVSVVATLADGRAFETASVGFEGVAGLLPALTDISPTTSMFVQIGGGAIRLPAEDLRQRACESPALMKLALRHAQINAAQAEQTIACNGAHALPERLARWLLICGDRVDGATMPLTQDYLGVMTGALRSSVSLTASAFKRDGLIAYSRGRLEILDRPGLERRVCECYGFDQASRNLLVSPH